MSHRHVLRTILAITCLLLSSAFAPAALADDPQEARASFERGVTASREQHWSDARAEFLRSLELLPKASTMFNLVLADIKLGLGREALEQLDAFERAASPQEHAAMLERARVLRPQAQALVQSEQSKAQNGGNKLSEADDGLSTEVRNEVAAARAHYEAGRDREALAAFEHAYRSSKRPQLLYNIGVVADRMRADARAVRAYEAFIAALPDAPEAAVAEVRSEALREALLAREHEAPAEAAPAASMNAATPRADSAPRDHGDLVAPRALLVVGCVMLGAAGGSLGWFIHRDNDLSYLKSKVASECEGDESCSNLSTVESERNAALAVTVATGALGLGLTTAGAILLVKRKSAARELARGGVRGIAPWWSERAAGLRVSGAF